MIRLPLALLSRSVSAAVLLFLCFLVTGQAGAAPVLMISIDGLRPDYVTHASEHGLKIPNLRRFVTEGCYAEGVVGVVPTITYPSHTTLVTGVWPAKHNILANTTFDPEFKNQLGWYWYASDVHAPTLWQAADKAGIVTASINWPVTVNASGIRYLIPEYWRAETPEDNKLIVALSRPTGWMEEMERTLGSYTNGNDTTIEGDKIRTRFAEHLLTTEHPGFTTLHLSSLDEAEHETAPFSTQSNETLEAIDAMIGQLVGAALQRDPATDIVIVSDHGFIRTDHRVNLLVPFIEKGWLKFGHPNPLTGTPRVESWQATIWPAGGMAAIMLRDPADTALREQVASLLDKLAGDPHNGIARVLSGDEAKRLGGFPDAAFVVALAPDYQLGYAFSGPLVTDAPSTGMHGYLPDNPEMRSSFFVLGANILPHQNVGVVDMRQIAPTVASLLGVALPTSDAAKIPVEHETAHLK